ncbi:MAG TPA: hypothetical protein GXZ61_04450 [Clostridiales bacterium]|jgi:alanyl-tRNA synthetase|nr:hypothetical protein [Clostridiales bacterium]
MTKKLFFENPNQYECEATVISVRETEKGTEIITDQTVVFPESGGQISDTGFMNGLRILRAYERDGTIIHVLDGKATGIKVNDTVKIGIDIDRRKDSSAQHSGEHILSGLAKKLFGAVNVGFHMSEEYSTLDFDIELTNEQLAELETEAFNEVIKNSPVTTEIVDADCLKTLSLRKKTEGLEDRADEFRIVYIGDVDSCTCCGTHVNFTGEIGAVKLQKAEKYKGGTRIWFLCGKRALSDYQKKHNIIDKIARSFSVNHDDALDAVVRQGDELREAKRTLKLIMARYVQAEAKSLIDNAHEKNGVKIIVYCDYEGLTDIRVLSENILKTRACAVLCSVAKDSVQYVTAVSEGVTPSASELIQAVNALMNGKGGGRGTFAQGKAEYKSRSQLEQCLAQVMEYLKKAV